MERMGKDYRREREKQGKQKKNVVEKKREFIYMLGKVLYKKISESFGRLLGQLRV